MNAAHQFEVANVIAADLARLVDELAELSDDAAEAHLVRAKMRIDRTITTLTTTLHGLKRQAGKLRVRATEDRER